MQFTIVTLTTLFAAALAAPSEVSARQAPLATLTTFSRGGCQPPDATGTVELTVQRNCKALRAGIVSAKIFTSIPAGCHITFHTGTNCLPATTDIYTYPDFNPDTTQCFGIGETKPMRSYNLTGTCGQ